MEMDKIYGDGKEAMCANARYEGEMNDHGQPHGRGTLTHELVSSMNGGNPKIMTLSAEFVNGNLHGDSRVCINGNVIYDGEWNKGWMTLLHPDGDAENPAHYHTYDITNKPKHSTINNLEELNLDQLESIWTFCSDVYSKKKFVNDKFGLGSVVDESSFTQTLVHNAHGPTDIWEFVRLVLTWFVLSTIFVFIMRA